VLNWAFGFHIDACRHQMSEFNRGRDQGQRLIREFPDIKPSLSTLTAYDRGFASAYNDHRRAIGEEHSHE
ncbi:hypothetical protein P8631_15790, partial [Guyparkeria sp. 1SP6A2]|nr:hypothetical protein [Guyparkeria sp. 1SP6A2]